MLPGLWTGGGGLRTNSDELEEETVKNTPAIGIYVRDYTKKEHINRLRDGRGQLSRPRKIEPRTSLVLI